MDLKKGLILTLKLLLVPGETRSVLVAVCRQGWEMISRIGKKEN